jgi:hypothetical protein
MAGPRRKSVKVAASQRYLKKMRVFQISRRQKAIPSCIKTFSFSNEVQIYLVNRNNRENKKE